MPAPNQLTPLPAMKIRGTGLVLDVATGNTTFGSGEANKDTDFSLDYSVLTGGARGGDSSGIGNLTASFSNEPVAEAASDEEGMDDNSAKKLEHHIVHGHGDRLGTDSP